MSDSHDSIHAAEAAMGVVNELARQGGQNIVAHPHGLMKTGGDIVKAAAVVAPGAVAAASAGTKLTELDNSGSNIKTRLIDIDEKAQDAARHFDETKTRLETEVQSAKTQLKTVMQDATTNFEALVHTAVAYLNVTHVILARGAAEPEDTNKEFLRSAALASALESVSKFLENEQFRPTDKMLLSWGYIIRGTISHLQGKYDSALQDFEMGLNINPDNNNAQYNAACAAARLQDKGKAVAYIQKVLATRPERRAEAKADQDLELIWDHL